MTLAEISKALADTKAAIAAVNQEIAYYGDRTCCAVVRLSDRRWDLQAREILLCKMFDAA